jgi:hypothetical protein
VEEGHVSRNPLLITLLPPRGGGVFLSSHNKIHDTHTSNFTEKLFLPHPILLNKNFARKLLKPDLLEVVTFEKVWKKDTFPAIPYNYNIQFYRKVNFTTSDFTQQKFLLENY